MSKPADSSLERIRRHLVGLKMPCALEYLSETVQRIERGELSTLEAIEALRYRRDEEEEPAAA